MTELKIIDSRKDTGLSKMKLADNRKVPGWVLHDENKK
jgi:ribosomal protein L39E